LKDSSPRQGAVRLTAEEQQRIVMMKQAAEGLPIQEGESPRNEHRAVFSGIYVFFVRVIDPEGECIQDRLSLWRETAQPGLDEVQALSALFFGSQSFQILPDPRDLRRVNVLGLFRPLLR